jgi:LytR cell envelope-related transcriptional attenuator
MADSGFTHKFKNYSLNALIILLAAITIYLIYSFYTRMNVTRSGDKKEIATDTSSVHITQQPSRQTLQIDVQNGSGVQGIANKFTDYLRANGFDVVETGNFSTSDIKTTMVIDRTGNIKNAKRVASSLGVPERYVIQQISKDYLLDATVVIGADYSELNPFKQK